MHSQAKARMRAEVIARISQAAESLGEQEGVTNFVALQQSAQRARDPEVQSIRELEAVADLLEALRSPGGGLEAAVEAIRDASHEDLVAVDGIGETKAKKLKAAV